MTAYWKTTGSALLLLTATACTSYFEVPIETPLQPKLDVSRFQRILVAGFLAGGSEDVDTNLETARLLRSQLRSESRLEVIDAEVLDLLSVAEMEGGGAFDDNGNGDFNGNGNGDGDTQGGAGDLPLSDEDRADLSEEDLETFEHIFANVSYWRQLGEEHQNPLNRDRHGPLHAAPALGHGDSRTGNLRRVRTPARRPGPDLPRPAGFVLSPTFIFIDGSTGVTLYTERHREEVLYDSTQNTPALSSYFELMDRLLPSFLGALADQSIRGMRIMLK